MENPTYKGKSPCHSGLKVSELEIQSIFPVHFPTDILGKGMNPLIPPAMG